MIDGICTATGKHPNQKESERKYYQGSIPGWNGDLCARLKSGFVKVDFDDIDKKTGDLLEPVKGSPRSEIVRQMLDDHGIRYNLMLTEHGKHFYFKLPENSIDSNKINWYSPIAIKAEWKLGGGQSKEHIPYKVNGVMRTWLKGSLDNDEIDFLPVWLYPLQKSAKRPFDLEIVSGDRNNGFSTYAFHLTQTGLEAEQAIQVIKLMNSYILEESLSDKEIDIILRPETVEKLKGIQDHQTEKNLSHVAAGDEVIKRFELITVNDNFYTYDSGVYTPITKEKINSFITKNHPTAKINFKREVIDYVKGQTFKEWDNIKTDFINVKNGMLMIDGDSVELVQHTKNIVQFTQINATYDPDATYPILDEMLLKVFDNSSEQIELFNQMLGYLLMNHVNYQKCFFMIGLPSSGKSTVINMIICFCGKDNVSSIDLNAFNKRFAISDIVNKTANIVADRQKYKIETSGIFKSLVTGDGITVERKYQQSFTYYNTTKLIFGMNHFPDFSNDFDGVERRVICIPCNHVFKKSDADFNPKIERDLTSDECMSALLNKAIKGYQSLIKNKGFISTAAADEVTKEFEKENDNVLRWLEETEDIIDRLESEPIKLGHKGLYPEYQAFCINIGEEANMKAQKDFSRTICNKFGYRTYQKRVDGEKPYFYKMK